MTKKESKKVLLLREISRSVEHFSNALNGRALKKGKERKYIKKQEK